MGNSTTGDGGGTAKKQLLKNGKKGRASTMGKLHHICGGTQPRTGRWPQKSGGGGKKTSKLGKQGGATNNSRRWVFSPAMGKKGRQGEPGGVGGQQKRVGGEKKKKKSFFRPRAKFG